MTESFNNSKINSDTDTKEYLSEGIINLKISEAYSKLKSIKEQYDDVRASWKNLFEDAMCFSFGKHLANGELKEQFQKVIDDLKMDYYDTKKTLEYYKELKNKPLLEAEIRLTPDALMDPSEAPKFREIAKKADDAEAARLAQIEADNKKAQLQDQVKDTVKAIEYSDDQFHTAFDLLVPREGKADTLAGELIRAIMRLIYRDWNDGDLFYEGYGLETCAPAASFLMDNGYWDEFEHILNKELRNDYYTKALEDIKDKILNGILDPDTGVELLTTPNTQDMLDSDTSWIKENQPRYDFEIYVSDAVEKHIDAENCDSWKLKEYVEEVLYWEPDLRDAEVETPWSRYDTTVTITNLTKDGLDRMEEMFNSRTANIFWEDLVNELNDEYGDPDEYEDNDDEESEEDIED